LHAESTRKWLFTEQKWTFLKAIEIVYGVETDIQQQLEASMHINPSSKETCYHYGQTGHKTYVCMYVQAI